MVDSVNNNNSGPISTLLRAQSVSPAALNTNRQVSQALINQLQNGAKPTTVQPTGKGLLNAGGKANGNLPRGSLVDILA